MRRDHAPIYQPHTTKVIHKQAQDRNATTQSEASVQMLRSATS